MYFALDLFCCVMWFVISIVCSIELFIIHFEICPKLHIISKLLQIVRFHSFANLNFWIHLKQFASVLLFLIPHSNFVICLFVWRYSRHWPSNLYKSIESKALSIKGVPHTHENCVAGFTMRSNRCTFWRHSIRRRSNDRKTKQSDDTRTTRNKDRAASNQYPA